MDEFGEYKRAAEPEKREKALIWRTAIGLQKVDGLTTSEYLRETARRNIEGEITIEESGRLIAEYYKSKPVREAAAKTRTDEADIVSQRIAAILSEPTFTFSPEELVSIHKRLFTGIYKFAGQIRDYNISKNEWVLKGASVQYASCYRLVETLAFDFGEEKKFSYAGLGMDEIIQHVAKFISGIWQIHAFGEGNTRTTAIFTIKYLRTLGFDVNNDLFAENAHYFRNALVRANYTSIPKGIDETTEYLERFFRNLLLGEANELKSRFLRIDGISDKREQAGEQITPTSKPVTHTSTHTSKSDTHTSKAVRGMALSDAMWRLLEIMDGEMSRGRIMTALKLKNRSNFLEYYLAPALKIGLLEMTQPGSPRSPTQKYRLTARGLELKEKIGFRA